jgi:hypothetical protein
MSFTAVNNRDLRGACAYLIYAIRQYLLIKENRNSGDAKFFKEGEAFNRYYFV